MEGEVYLTREGYDKLKSELEHLQKVKRKEISKSIEHAREMGDISENAEYDAAKDAQAHCEAKIAQLQEKLSRVRIIDDENIPADRILIGARVLLRDMDTEEEVRYRIVSQEEADYEQGKISMLSPVGKALMQKKEGDIVEINIPAGILKYKVLEISR